jgi:prepilin-type N-terminal cleavage/methylation domain-containing protein
VPRNVRNERGVSLIELAVVLLIIAILVGAAIPLLSGGPERGNERRAQSDLRNSLVAAQTIAGDHDGLFVTDEDTEITPADLDAEDASIEHVATMPSTAGPVYVNVQGGGDRITLVRLSGSGGFLCISATRAGQVRFDSHPDDGTAIDTHADCDGEEW